MKKLFFIAVMFFCVLNSYSQTAENKTWVPIEFNWQAGNKMTNPYVEGLIEGEKPYLTVEFSGTGGPAAGKSYTVPGFWDGDRIWTVRFAPPYAGEWSYISRSTDRALHGKKGTLHVSGWKEFDKDANPTHRGIIQVNDTDQRKGRYFVYADGTPFLWIGDTWWNWTKADIRFDSFKKLADTRADQGFTVGQLFFAGNGWSHSSSLLDPGYMHPKIDQIHRIEKMIRYANEKGITVWIHAWWSRKDIDEHIGPENIRRWWRYVIARLQAYNVIWVLAGEYNMNNYGGLGPGFWKELGNLVKEEDPYDRITSVHPTPPGWDGGADAPQWSTAEVIHTQKWLDYNQSQPGHGKWRNELIPSIVKYAYSLDPPKPIVVSEPWYEFIEGNPEAVDIRFGAWTAILSGAAGHSYAGGHVWKAHVPESPAGIDSWPMDTSFQVNTMFYNGALSMSFLSHFLQKIDWWKLEPYPEFVMDNASKFCAALPGKEYLVYLRYGGSARMDLTTAPENQMQFEWIDMENRKTVSKGTVQGGRIVRIYPPEDYPGAMEYKDWLLHIFSK